MAAVLFDQLADHLNIAGEIGDADGALLDLKLQAAQGYVENMLGFSIAERYGTQAGPGDTRPVPAPLIEAILQLAAHWYENREAAGDALREIPFGVSDIVNAYRDWSF